MRRRILAWAIVATCLAPQTGAQAVQPDELLADPRLELRARHISAELRCLVCQNQSIDDSDAPLARDLRLAVRSQLRTGASDDEVREFVVSRYGEFVLLKPVFAWHTALLWLGPAFVLAAAAGGLWRARGRKIARDDGLPLTLEEEKAIASIRAGERS